MYVYVDTNDASDEGVLRPQKRGEPKKVPLLHCSSHQTLELMITHPQQMYIAQMKKGAIRIIPRKRFFKIPISRLNPDKTVVHIPSETGESKEWFWLNDVALNNVRVPLARVLHYGEIQTNTLTYIEIS